MTVTSVLFVCTGNICRSPLAEGIFLHLAAERGEAAAYRADSAGTGGWHEGEAPDRRSIHVAALNGIDISGQRARKITGRDFERFDLILGMDRGHVAALKARAPSDHAGRIHLFSRFAAARDFDIPDPYYGGPDDFADVYNMLLSGCGLLLERLLSMRGS
ncbi:low molecular weight phosphotyrosine protein phosphatase [Rhizobiaceae bacterium BDR2-2]|uniref:protein-tyrosine-phosphatase n=1 Tax=Ectorhizobium quercum TaxID=2965071 RepID=A0AAE3N3N3_9HYPH|nr:low molecular weight protein-tyrosine-phosphatase [Ectorhizobium quercum]MCX8999331.1 low molecular weight phosphotyrosine protein phosphatase [Ectorhizobium quercum]